MRVTNTQVGEASRLLRSAEFGGRFTLRGSRWITFSPSFGQFDRVHSTNLGEGADPNLIWNVYGMPIRQGETVRHATMIGRGNSTSVPAVDVRFYYGRKSPAATVWAGNSDVEFTLIGQLLNGFAPTPAMSNENVPMSFDAPSDGMVVPVFRMPNGPGSNRYLMVSGTLEILEAV